MRKTKAQVNPYGTPAKGTVVRVGREGVHTHLLDPKKEAQGVKVHLCRSGIKFGKMPDLYVSESKYVTCYRCQKLMRLNKGR